MIIMASVYDPIMEPGVGVMGEFDAPEKLTTTYCRPLTEEEYENQGASETEKALKELIAFMECHPEHYAEVVRRKKVDEMENAGFFSFLKVRAVQLIRGEQYPTSLVQASDCHHQLNHLKRDMISAFKYSLEAKGRRCSKRLVEKQQKKQEEAKKVLEMSPTLRKKTRTSPKGKENQAPNVTPSKTPVAKVPPCSLSRLQIPPPPPPPAPPSATRCFAGQLAVRDITGGSKLPKECSLSATRSRCPDS